MKNNVFQKPFRRKRKLSRTMVWLCLGLIIVIFVGMVAVWKILLTPPGYIDFYLHQSRYEGIVKAVKARPIAAGERKDLRVNRSYNPSSLRERDLQEEIARGDAVGLIRVERSKEGDYAILIFTFDHGHAGLGGYTYQDEASFQLREEREPEYERYQINEKWSAYYEDGG